ICFCSAVAVLPLLHSFPTRRSSDLEKFRKDRGRQYDEQRYPRGDRTLSRIDLWMVQRGDDLAWKTRKILFLCCPRICCSFVCFHIYQTETGAETGAGERQDQSTERRGSIQNRKTGRYSWNSGYEVSGKSGSVGMGASDFCQCTGSLVSHSGCRRRKRGNRICDHSPDCTRSGGSSDGTDIFQKLYLLWRAGTADRFRFHKKTYSVQKH